METYILWWLCCVPFNLLNSHIFLKKLLIIQLWSFSNLWNIDIDVISCLQLPHICFLKNVFKPFCFFLETELTEHLKILGCVEWYRRVFWTNVTEWMQELLYRFCMLGVNRSNVRNIKVNLQRPCFEKWH